MKFTRPLACLLVAYEALSQTVPEYMTCDDKRDKCKLDCVLSLYLQEIDESDVDTCRVTCHTERDTCSDSSTVVSIIECLTECSSLYDGAMNECLHGPSKVKRATAGKGQDECSILASEAMDDCSSACYGPTYDSLGGWTPDKEAGRGSNSTWTVPKQRLHRSEADDEISYESYTT